MGVAGFAWRPDLDVRLRRAENNARPRTASVLTSRGVAGRVVVLPSHPRITARGAPDGRGHPIIGLVPHGVVPCRSDLRRGELWRHATSLGGVESTWNADVATAASPEHVDPAPLRLSVGIEDVEDLWADLAAALSQ